MKMGKFIIVAVVFILVMSTVSYAATARSDNGTAVSVEANMNDYSPSVQTDEKTSGKNSAEFTNIKGGSQAMGFQFMVFAQQKKDGKHVTTTGLVQNEYTTNLTLMFSGLTDAQLLAGYTGEYFLKAKLVGYPRASSATVSGKLAMN